MSARSVALSLAGVDAELAAELIVHVGASRNLLRQANRDISPRMDEHLELLRHHISECRNSSQPAPVPHRPADDEHVGNLRRLDEGALTVAEVAVALRVDRSTVYRWSSHGQGLPLRGPRGRQRIAIEDLVAWLNQRAA